MEEEEAVKPSGMGRCVTVPGGGGDGDALKTSTSVSLFPVRTTGLVSMWPADINASAENFTWVLFEEVYQGKYNVQEIGVKWRDPA